jgi:hypothetical protein
MAMTSKEELRVRIREAMRRRRVCVQDFMAMGVSRQGVYNIINGRVSPQRVSAKMRQAFLILLGIDLLDYDLGSTKPAGNGGGNERGP